MAFLASSAGWHTTTAFAGEIDFNRDIRPILADKCFRCHGPDSGARQADLRLDREADAKADREGNPAIVPRQAAKSELVRRITHADESERMPPAEAGKPLSAAEINLLGRWIDEGALWSPAWAYVPPKRVATPEVRDTSWPANWIDRFILARLESEQLSPSPDADSITLVRRLYIDVTGLPPTPADVEAFRADLSPQAYERLVDRLLASPHYGERMAAYWLDLVRYADTVGYHGDQEHHISAYRDYVINAFNNNLAFDQFTREQLAGDLLAEPTIEQTIATGYNRLLQTSHEGGVQPKEYLAIYAADHVRNLSAVWLGATLGCAQCHDHKYDPYTSRDFYSMQAFFADVDEAKHLTRGSDRSPTVREPELELPTPEQSVQIAEIENRLEELKRKRREILAAAEVASNEKPVEDKSAESAEAEKDKPRTEKPPEPLKKEIAACEEELKKAHEVVRRTMITVSINPRPIRVLPRGNWLDDSGEIVEPAIPAFLGQIETGDRRATRLDLANWLTGSREGIGGLTARVIVNRLWYLFYGAGLSRSLEDFGGQGEAPSHPELLDALARELIESGWDLKRTIKLLVTSRAYKQSSRETSELHNRDPLNRLLARQASFRYPAEAVRDTVLSISGLLVDVQGGPSVHPYQPAGYYRHLNFPEREYRSDKDERQWRRAVYTHWQRQYLHPMLKAFDAPSREECTAERPRSNTALAALVLLHDPTFVEASRAFATRILREGGIATDERITYAFRRALCRSPDADELQALAALLRTSEESFAAAPDDAERLLAIGLTPIPADLNHAQLASWTMVARAILNLSETLTRN
ncbi:MAG TPA: DUF1553 domain-containing protein [Pirellulales bacterium]|nr:DUF1553 domain-containing protein [Pirellulales bacterium]